MARREAAIPRGPSNATPVFAARCEGATIEDVDGNRYLDFAGGIGCLTSAIVSPRALRHPRATREALAPLFCRHSLRKLRRRGGKTQRARPLAISRRKTILVNSGAEAIENSIKIARAYTKRPAVICFEDAFHGRTLLTMCSPANASYNKPVRAFCQ